MSDDKIRKQAEKLLSLAMILEDDFEEEAKNKIAYLDKVVVLLEPLQTPLNNDYELMAICHRELASLYAAFFPKQEKQEEHYNKAVKFAQLSNSKNENIDFAHEVKQYIQQEVETHKSTLEFFSQSKLSPLATHSKFSPPKNRKTIDNENSFDQEIVTIHFKND